MRIRVGQPAALVVAVSVLAATISATHAPTTTAAPLVSLTANNFQRIATNGFGDPQNSWAWSMDWFNNRLLVGTNRDLWCAQNWAQYNYYGGTSVYPPLQVNASVPCDPIIQRMPMAAQIWSIDPSVSPPVIQKVYEDPYNQQVPIPISATTTLTNAPRDFGFRGMSTFQDPGTNSSALYIGGVSMSPIDMGPNDPHVTVAGPSLLRTTDGVNFTETPDIAIPTYVTFDKLPVPQVGCCIRDSLTYNGIRIGSNPPNSPVFYANFVNFQGVGLPYATANPSQGGTWTPVLPTSSPYDFYNYHDLKGFQVYEMAVFNNSLYLGLQANAAKQSGTTPPGGYAVVKITGCISLPCPASSIKVIIPQWGGLTNSGIDAVISMHVFTDTANIPHLYIGTQDDNSQPVEIDRINLDDSWDLVVGTPRFVSDAGIVVTHQTQCNCIKYPISGLGAGFNWPDNLHMWRMEDYKGVLYVGTFNNASNLYTLQPSLTSLAGFHLWASSDGTTFSPVTLNGFGDPNNEGARTIKSTPYGLFIGTANSPHGTQIWQGSVSGSALRSSARRLASHRGKKPHSIALSWEAPSTGGATTYHVYRSATQVVTVPTHIERPDPDFPSATRGPRVVAARTMSVPGAFQEIATTTHTYFVDSSVDPRVHYNYYVVTQDDRGYLSAPSNMIGDPRLAMQMPATFASVAAFIQNAAVHGSLNGSAIGAVERRVAQAAGQLRRGDATAASTLLEQAIGLIGAQAHSLQARAAAEPIAITIDSLNQRVSLVGANALAASQVQ